ncbi:major facilitator superfamily domain-containing protein [Suillus bovinus]|uniref:major facilitator superfamily domain-containing protein n=1 Tax=Suillus bovinus TaxID=48563 RepID=UPI001B86C36D|nr:major facilitator superfamily domain-containing protein [Suillus bovinus]KAG2156796.1 major facilitator superfamily domain-containing protein [Suillus bovinus]
MSTPFPSDETAKETPASVSKPIKSAENASLVDSSVALGFPEGGFTAWGTVLGACLIQFCGFGYTSAYGVFQDFYTQTYLTNSTPSAIAWIGSVNAFLVLSVGVVSGRMVDRGAFYPLMKIGCLLQCLFLFILSLAKPDGYYQIFLSQGVGFGIAIGLTNIPSIAIVSHHFQRCRAVAMGIVVAGSSLGAILHPVILNNLINRRLGFANGVRASATLNSGLLFIANLLMRTRIPPQLNAVSYTRILKNSSRDGAYICACVAMTAFEFGYFFEVFYLQLDSTLHGLSEGFSFYSLTILSFGSFIGRLTAGVVSAYVGIPNTVVGSLLISSAVIFAMIGLQSAVSVAVIAASYGLFSGNFIALMGPLVSYLTPENSHIGARMGIMFAISSVGSLLGAPICGAFLTSHYIWWKAAVFAGSVATGGCIALVFMQVILKMRQKASSVCSKEAGV